MTLETGRIIRRVGLLIEATALCGFAAVTRFQVGGGREGDFHPANLLAIGVGVGFFVWAFGTAAIYRARAVLKNRVRPLDL